MTKVTEFQQTFGNRGGYELAPGSVFGLRWWRVEATQLRWYMGGGYPDEDTWLQGAFSTWSPGNNQAVCLAPGSRMMTSYVFRSGPWTFSRVSMVQTMEGREPPMWEPHSPPGDVCPCGFYAYWRPENHSQVGGDVLAQGVIEGWGRTLIGDAGFRCEKARIVGLRLVREPCPCGEPCPCECSIGRRAGEPVSKKLERTVSERYGVPVYATAEEMLARHPLTTDYLPKGS
jgi:hypothetical protein